MSHHSTPPSDDTTASLAELVVHAEAVADYLAAGRAPKPIIDRARLVLFRLATMADAAYPRPGPHANVAVPARPRRPK